jgi:hypothetical protein
MITPSKYVPSNNEAKVDAVLQVLSVTISTQVHPSVGTIVRPKGMMLFVDSQTGMLSGIPGSAICVQRLDDSRSAIHITYRISLRSSSLREPRDPLLKVILI